MLALESAEKNLQFNFIAHTDGKLLWDQNETQWLLIKGTKISFMQGSYLRAIFIFYFESSYFSVASFLGLIDTQTAAKNTWNSL